MVGHWRFFFEQIMEVSRVWSDRLEVAKMAGDMARKQAMDQTDYERIKPFNDLIVLDNYGKRYGMSPKAVLLEPNELVYSIMLMDEEVNTFDVKFKQVYKKLKGDG